MLCHQLSYAAYAHIYIAYTSICRSVWFIFDDIVGRMVLTTLAMKIRKNSLRRGFDLYLDSSVRDYGINQGYWVLTLPIRTLSL